MSVIAPLPPGTQLITSIRGGFLDEEMWVKPGEIVTLEREWTPPQPVVSVHVTQEQIPSGHGGGWPAHITFSLDATSVAVVRGAETTMTIIDLRERGTA